MSFKAALRQLGMDSTNLPGREAEDLWNKLNDMAEKDPEEYQNFINNQMQEAKHDDAANRRRGFRPEKGLAIRTSYLQGNGKPVIINLCSFAGVEVPQDASGKPVQIKSSARPNLSGLNIPLAVSPLRDAIDEDSGEEVIVLDAVFHPWVVAQAGEFSSFQAQIIELALTWCESEARGKLSRKYSQLPKNYYDTDAMGLTAFFEVDHSEDDKRKQNESSDKNRKIPDDVMAQPENLLGALREESISSEAEQDHIKISTDIASSSPRNNTPMVVMPGNPPSHALPKQDASTKKKPLVQEVKPKAQKASAAKASSAVKKGFLQNTNGALYGEEGSKEGIPTSLYQRAKIVDLNKMSPEEVHQVMQQHGGGVPPQPSQKMEPSQLGASQTALPADKMHDASLKMFEQAFQGLSQPEKDAFEKLAESVDSEFAKRNIDEREVSNGFTDIFKDLSKTMSALGIGDDFSTFQEKESSTFSREKLTENEKGSSAKASSQNPSVETISNPPPIAQAPFQVDYNTANGELKVIVEVGRGCSLAEIDVEISDTKVRLVCLNKKSFADTPIKLPVSIDRDSARAKLSKKTGKLTIKAIAVSK